jgi:hypothetical protein
MVQTAPLDIGPVPLSMRSGIPSGIKSFDCGVNTRNPLSV